MRLEITAEERDELLRLVENYLEETRVEAHHTQGREYRSQIRHEEGVLRQLLDKLRQLPVEDIPRQMV